MSPLTAQFVIRHRDERKAWCVTLHADTIRDDVLPSPSADTPNWYVLQTVALLDSIS